MDNTINTEDQQCLSEIIKLPYSELNQKHQSIFIHIPKTAGSSIEKVIYKTKGQIGHKTILQYKNADAAKFESYFSFAFTRNPYDRLVSAYFYLIKGGRNKFDKAWSDDNLMQYGSFENFVLALDKPEICEQIFKWMHFIPQYKFVCDSNNKILVDFIGKLESINTDFPIVTKKLGIETPLLPHENPSEHDVYETYYIDSMRYVVQKIYKDDFELFGYS